MSDAHSVPSSPRLVAASGLDEILRRRLISSVFQPIVDLDTGALFGFEALARGPEGSPLEQPDQLFEAAREEGRIGELDHACQLAAVDGARRHRLEAPLTVFVNVEPHAVGFGPLPRIGDGVQAVVELKERCLTDQLPELLPSVERARIDSWGVALDDVGTDPRCLALMPVVRPDVIKLDLDRIGARSAHGAAATAEAACTQAERTGATVLAEGIETADQLQHARALGATLGQGHLFGHPTAHPRRANVTGMPLRIPGPSMPPSWRTPFDLASAQRPVRRGAWPLLAAIAGELERKAAASRGAAMLIRSLPDAVDAPRSRRARELLAGQLALGISLSSRPAPRRPVPGLRDIVISEDDPLYGTWNVLVIGPRSASMLAARTYDREPTDGHQTLDFVVTYDRALVIECAQALLLRIAAVGVDADGEERAGRLGLPRRSRLFEN